MSLHSYLRLSRRKVIIAFTHSEAVMKAAAAINVVEKGRLAAVGTHQELSAQGRLAEAISDL